MFLFCLVFAMSLCASVYMCFVATCWERADLLALVYGVYYEFVTFPLVSWVRCGSWLYRFLIFAPLLTFITLKRLTKWTMIQSYGPRIITVWCKFGQIHQLVKRIECRPNWFLQFIKECNLQFKSRLPNVSSFFHLSLLFKRKLG